MHINMFLFLFFLFQFFLVNTVNEKKIPRYKCGFDQLTQLPQNAIYRADKNSDNLFNINLKKEDDFKDFDIFLDLVQFNDQIIEYNLTEQKEFYETGIKKVINTIRSLLKVKKIDDDYCISDEQLIMAGLKKWDKTKIGNDTIKNNKGMISLGIDLYIFINLERKEEIGETVIASARTLIFQLPDHQPLCGIININIDMDYSFKNSLEYFESTIIHEFTHILGFSRNYFIDYFNHTFYKIDEYGIKRYYINSTKVLNIAKKYYNCNTIEGVQLEEGGGNGTTGSHWEERYLLGEYMIGQKYLEEEVISEFTLAYLEDTGYYKANYYTGGLMQFGKNKGCEFLNSKCANNSKVNPKFKNEFYDHILVVLEPSCSSGRQSRTYKTLLDYNSGIPEYFQYFNSNITGGYRPSADYCPIFGSDSYFKEKIYFLGKCSEIGSQKYGSSTPYKDENKNEITFQNGELALITSEKYSENSFCVISNLRPKNITDNPIALNMPRAICYQMFCSDRSLTIRINKDFIVCPRGGGKIRAMDFKGDLLCPDYNLICSGTVICNDIFDCVEKKSLLKDVIYDYETKTSQDYLEQGVIEYEIDYYELSNNGKCPLFCIQCNEFGHCKKCKNGTEIVELNQNNTIKRKCQPINELEHGYYKNEENNIYYKCLDNCDKCINGDECISCNSGFFQQNNKCLKNIDNCKKYDDNGRCIECKSKYKIKENGNICKKKSKKTIYIIFGCCSAVILIIIIFVVIYFIYFKPKKNLKDEVNKISFKEDEDRDNKEETLLYS